MTTGPYVGRGLLGIVAIVAFGAVLAETDVTRGSSNPEQTLYADRLDAIAVVGSYEQRVVTGAFGGGEVTAVMGSVEIDLREAEMAADSAVVEIRVAMGSVELRVPDHWRIAPDLGPGLGGSSVIRAASPPAGPGAPVLILRGPVLLGSVEVGN